jgi:hypothetical protein
VTCFRFLSGTAALNELVVITAAAGARARGGLDADAHPHAG